MTYGQLCYICFAGDACFPHNASTMICWKKIANCALPDKKSVVKLLKLCHLLKSLLRYFDHSHSKKFLEYTCKLRMFTFVSCFYIVLWKHTPYTRCNIAFQVVVHTLYAHKTLQHVFPYEM